MKQKLLADMAFSDQATIPGKEGRINGYGNNNN